MARFTSNVAFNFKLGDIPFVGKPGVEYECPDDLWVEVKEAIKRTRGTASIVAYDRSQVASGTHPDLAAHISLGLLSSAGAHDHDGVYAPVHAHDYAAASHGHIDLSPATHAHAGGDHPDLATHEALGLAATHAHPYASSGHDHDAAYLHAHPYASDAHDHAGVYAPVHSHPYAATVHTHAQSQVTNLTTDLAGKAATSHLHTGTYAPAVHTHAGGGADVKSGIVSLGSGGTANVSFATPFQSVPQVVAIPQFSTTDTSTTISAYNVTVNGFTLRGAGNAAGNVAWIATNAGNP